VDTLGPVRRLTLLLASLIAAGALAGCSASGTSKSAKNFSGPKKDVAAVVDDLSSAGSKRDAKEVCTSIFSRQLVSKLSQGTRDCQAVIKDQLKDADVFGLDVKTVDISGNTATASVTSKVDGSEKAQTLTFVRQNGAWRISGIQG
jgi:hypothetical protein